MVTYNLLNQWCLYVPSPLTPEDFSYCVYIFMCFVWISEQTAIISLYKINWLGFLTETECVYCEVRAEYLCAIQVSFTQHGLTLRDPGSLPGQFT